MRLKTFGGLALESSTLTRPKPLLLLAYLNLEGSRSRRDLAELFWRESKDPMQNLRTALSQINRDAPEAVQTDDKKIWTELKSDHDELQELLERDDFEGVLELYQGPFLEGFALDEIGEELEEWIFQKRERVAGQVRDVLLELAQSEAAKELLMRLPVTLKRPTFYALPLNLMSSYSCTSTHYYVRAKTRKQTAWRKKPKATLSRCH